MPDNAQLNDVFEQLRSDTALARQFTEDPAQVLQQLGVDPSTVTVNAINAAGAYVPPQDDSSDIRLGAAEVTVCGSVGCVACVSVG